MATDPLVGRALGRYRIERRLGGGGMASVYRASHRDLAQTRAIKVMSPTLAAHPSFVQLFYREARLAAGLHHPNIVRIYDVAQHRRLHYLVMELLEGRALDAVIRDDATMPLTRVLHLVSQLADALDYAHQRGIAHRDIKPSNAFVSPSDVLTLVDFGIARAADATHLTVTHGIGTPEYMAPEVFEERLLPPGGDEHTIGVGTDLYSLGIVAYELVTGRVPFAGRTPNAIAYAKVNREPPSPCVPRPDLPAAVEDVILRQLARIPGDRYHPARAFSAALAEAIAQGQPVARARPTVRLTETDTDDASSDESAWVDLVPADHGWKHLILAAPDQAAAAPAAIDPKEPAPAAIDQSGLADAGLADSGLPADPIGLPLPRVREMTSATRGSGEAEGPRARWTPTCAPRSGPGGEGRPGSDGAISPSEAITPAIPWTVPEADARIPLHLPATEVRRLPPDGSEPAASPAPTRRRWLASVVALLLVAGLFGVAGLPPFPLISPAADVARLAESRPAAAPTLGATATTASVPTATVASTGALPTAVAAAPTPANAAPAGAPAPAPAASAPPTAPSLDRRIDEIVARTRALIDDPLQPNADLAFEQLDRLHRELDPDHPRRPDVEELMLRALFDESRRRHDAAFVLKADAEGQVSRSLLGDARQRLDRAASLRPTDAGIQDRAHAGREQVTLTGWWIDFDVAYRAGRNDAQIEALTQILATSPDYRTAEGPAWQKLYAAWIARAEEAWAARDVERARLALDEAAKLDPNHPRARDLRFAWFPPRVVVPARAAAPKPTGGWSAAARGAEAEPAPAPPAPEPPARQRPAQRTVQVVETWVQPVEQGSIDHNQPINSD